MERSPTSLGRTTQAFFPNVDRIEKNAMPTSTRIASRSSSEDDMGRPRGDGIATLVQALKTFYTEVTRKGTPPAIRQGVHPRFPTISSGLRA